MADWRKGKAKMATPASSVHSSTESNTYIRFAADRQTALLVKNHFNYRKSDELDRLLFHDEEGKWWKYAEDIQILAKSWFQDKIPAVEVAVDGRNVLLDFYRMIEVDFQSGYERSIGWMDVNGRYSFPKDPVNSGRDSGIGVDRVKVKDGEVTSKRKRDEEGGGGDPEVAHYVAPIPYEAILPRWPGTTFLIEDLDDEYKIVRDLFLNGLRAAARDLVIVTAIHQIVKEAPMWSRRDDAFARMSASVNRKRGGGIATTTYAWYGASAASIRRYLASGEFSPEDLNLSGPRGVGIYLSSSIASRFSTLFAEPDESGQKHVVLCRIILGKTETVTNSSQVFPSSPAFDTGVDTVATPKWHVVWPADMNTHIFPEMVLTFRGDAIFTDPPWNDAGSELPSSLADYAVFVSRIGKTLPASPARDLQHLFGLWKNFKIVEEVFIRRLGEFAEEGKLREIREEIRSRRGADLEP